MKGTISLVQIHGQLLTDMAPLRRAYFETNLAHQWSKLKVMTRESKVLAQARTVRAERVVTFQFLSLSRALLLVQ